MKIDDAIETTTRFFNDLIGSLIPGAILACGLFVMHIGPGLPDDIAASLPKDSGFLTAILLALMFAAGHGLLAIHGIVIDKALQRIGFVEGNIENRLAKKHSYELFKALFFEKLKQSNLRDTGVAQTDNWDHHDLRNVALSVSSEGSSLGRRFMFISLLCNGTGTVLLILTIDFISCEIFRPSALFPYANAWHPLIQIVVLMGVAAAFFKRAESFNIRAMVTPFAVAVAEMSFNAEAKDAKGNGEAK